MATAAERQKRYRERKRAAEFASEAAGDPGDVVRTFLEGVVSDGQAAIAGGNAPAWILRLAASASELLDAVDAALHGGDGKIMALIALAQGARTPEDHARVAETHEAAYRAWLVKRGRGSTRASRATSDALRLSASILAHVDAERRAGNASAASLGQGIAAAKRLMAAAQTPGSAADWRQFTATAHLTALYCILDSEAPKPYPELIL